MDKLRLRFEKTGRAVYISHLDLMRTMQRAFQRAGLSLKYSEGFNPHPQLSILLPLGVGCASRCELMDLRLREETELETLPERLSAALPEGIRALEAYPAARKAGELKWLLIDGFMEYDDRDAEEMCASLRAFFAGESLVIRKKTKRGEGETDIAPAIREIAFNADPRPEACDRYRAASPEPRQLEERTEVLFDTFSFKKKYEGVGVRCVLSAQEPTTSPNHLLLALRQLAPDLAPDFASFTRRETYAADMTVFR